MFRLSKENFLVLFMAPVMFRVLFENAISPMFVYYDKVILFITVPIILLIAIYSSKVNKAVICFFILSLLLVILSFNAFFYRDYTLILAQVVFHLKFFIFSLVVIYSGITQKKLVYFLAVIVISGVFLNFIFSGNFNSLVGVESKFRNGIIRPVGWFGDTAVLGFATSICYIYFCDRYKELSAQKVIFDMSFIAFCLLVSVRTPILAVFIMNVRYIKTTKGAMSFIYLTPILVALLFISDSLYYYVQITIDNIKWMFDSDSGYIRGIMIYYSVINAIDYFPFGSGASTFGTVFSDDSYIYTKFGLENSMFILEKKGIYDSNLASILGEFGVLGLVLYFWLFDRFCYTASSFYRRNRYSIFSYVVIYSITNPIFMSSILSCILAVFLMAKGDDFESSNNH